MAPAFEPEALEILSKKKNLRLLEVKMEQRGESRRQYVGVTGGLLVQDADTRCLDITDAMTVTKRHPDARLLADMDFGWRIVKHVKSNAIVVVKDGATVGVGAGQMNRVGSAGIALEEAKAAGATEGLVLASDGFLPFDDTVEQASPLRRGRHRTAWRLDPRRGLYQESRRERYRDALHRHAPL